MGLFSNNKKLCPICGNATPRLLARKVEGTAICGDCDSKLDMRKDKLNTLTLQELEQYMEFYAANEPLRTGFTPDFEKGAGFFGGKSFRCDSTHHTFKTSIVDKTITYEAEHFVRLLISQDNTPVIELTKDALVIHETGVLAKLEALRSEVDAYNATYELTNSMIRLHNDVERMKENRGRTFEEMREEEDPTRDERPDFRCNVPFEHWHIALEVDHPWGEGLKDKDAQVYFDSKRPSLASAIDHYQTSLAGYKEMAMAFRKAVCPNAKIVDETAGTTSAGTASAGAGAVSAADELKKFKDLLDAGVITEEEFAAKKAQLLGL